MIDKEEMEIKLNNEGYDVLDIDEFLVEHFENLKSVEDNVKKFLENHREGDTENGSYKGWIR